MLNGSTTHLPVSFLYSESIYWLYSMLMYKSSNPDIQRAVRQEFQKVGEVNARAQRQKYLKNSKIRKEINTAAMW